MTDHYQWVKTNPELASLCSELELADAVALDTEFVRTETFYANLGLIQAAVGDQTWLIDPLGISDWSSFNAILTNPAIVKVFHALSEDAEVLQHHTGALPVNVFDTQIAAGFLDHPVQVSYAKLVTALFDQPLSKEATRSNWLQRPLSKEQCFYAAADVHWLYKIYVQFQEKLNQSGRYEWVLEDSQRLVQNNLPLPAQSYYLKLRGAWRLKGQRLQALQRVCEWREQEARAQNVNRSRIVSDKELIELCETMPKTKEALKKVGGFHSRKIRLFGDEILSLLSATTTKDATIEPISPPLPPEQANLLKRVRQAVDKAGAEHDIPAEILARRKGLEVWVNSGARTGQFSAPEIFTGWRSTYIVDAVNHLLNQHWASQHEA